MRFLCLHGMGTNSQIFEMQTAAIRHALGDNHTYDFVEGSVPKPRAPGIEAIASADDEYFAYLDETSVESCLTALRDLESYIEAEGPFDAVMAFSQGAGFAAALMVHKLQQNPMEQLLHPLFKCAVFFCGGIPGDPASFADGKIRTLHYDTDGELIHVPTAHIWGANDQEYPEFGPVLSKLCNSTNKIDIIFEGGHEVPGSRNKDALTKSVQAIRRTVQRALSAQ